jgi:hypothetical protein
MPSPGKALKKYTLFLHKTYHPGAGGHNRCEQGFVELRSLPGWYQISGRLTSINKILTEGTTISNCYYGNFFNI